LIDENEYLLMSLQGRIKPSNYKTDKYFNVLLNDSKNGRKGDLRMILEVIDDMNNLRIEFRDDLNNSRDNRNSIIDENHVSNEQYMNHYLENRVIIGVKDIQDNHDGKNKIFFNLLFNFKF
jgi:hypothetical protein